MAAPKKPDRHDRDDRSWERRVRSPAFRRELTVLITTELRALSRQPVRDVIDPETVRAVIREWDGRILDERAVAELLITGRRRAAVRLRKQAASIRSKLGGRLATDIDAMVQEGVRLSRHAEEFIADTMRQEFMRRLFSDILFTSLVAFQEKVNPFFGGITMRLLEERIRGFIDLFMPLLQQQATAFAISRQNQRVLRDFFRSIIWHLLDAPLSHYAGLTASEQAKEMDELLRTAILHAADEPKLHRLMRDMALACWDDLYALVRDQRVGELLRLDEHAEWIAQRAGEALVLLLCRAGVRQFIAREYARGAARNK